MAELSLVSVNIERSKHLDRVLPFLTKEKPDVACMQEVFKRDIPLIRKALGGAEHVFAPMCIYSSQEEGSEVMGVAIFSRLGIEQSEIRFYEGPAPSLPEIEGTNEKTFNNKNLVLLACTIGLGRDMFTISTTHFRWTPDGSADDAQRKALSSLLSHTAWFDDLVLTGDFNAPRGGEIFSEIAKRYKDNIPAKYKTSLDSELHRSGKERSHELVDKMVDGLFTTPGYVVSNVELVNGISDHCAIKATISNS